MEEFLNGIRKIELIMKKVLLISACLISTYISYGQRKLLPTEEKILVHYIVTDYNHIPEMDATVQITHTGGEEIVGIVENDGRFSCLIPKGDHTRILLRKFQQAFDFTFDMPSDPGKYEMEQELKIQVTRNFMREFVLDGVIFEPSSKDYTSESYMKLYEFFTYAKTKPDLRLEIANYTFTEDSKEKNILLSQDRAIAIQNYMTMNGIDWDKMMAKGYGSSKPSLEVTPEQLKSEVTIIKVAFE